ncbi:hypothetical protein BGP_6652 [Beggiatoa sp. PS]|nr:hypothetical protein BGP_6652 [Beggiatoa sp. PS]
MNAAKPIETLFVILEADVELISNARLLEKFLFTPMLD